MTDDWDRGSEIGDGMGTDGISGSESIIAVGFLFFGSALLSGSVPLCRRWLYVVRGCGL